MLIARPKAPCQVHTWPLWVVLIPRIKSNHPFFTFSINPYTLSLCVEYYGATYHEIIYGPIMVLQCVLLIMTPNKNTILHVTFP